MVRVFRLPVLFALVAGARRRAFVDAGCRCQPARALRPNCPVGKLPADIDYRRTGGALPLAMCIGDSVSGPSCRAAAAGLPSAADLREEAARAEALAASGAGAVAKTAAGVGGSLRRQWLRWVSEHGAAYGFDDTEGPTVEHVLHFQTHGFTARKNYSTVQLDGLGDSWGELAVPYLLAKFVFPELEYPGWVGLTAEELAAKCKPYTLEARTHWKRLKVSHVRGGVDNGRSLAKDKWDDGLLQLDRGEAGSGGPWA